MDHSEGRPKRARLIQAHVQLGKGVVIRALTNAELESICEHEDEQHLANVYGEAERL
jgi:hypothetical protein